MPAIMGTGASPNVEVKSNPYRIFHIYEQLSQITYRLDQDSYVTVKLLPPGVSDPASQQAIVITNNELQSAQSGGQPVDHTTFSSAPRHVHFHNSGNERCHRRDCALPRGIAAMAMITRSSTSSSS